jgi:glycerol-3-phosphate dehydrogenase [NAD(P)+]
MKTIAIIGSGSWGVALAIHLANLGNQVKIWSFMQEEADLINQERKCKFLPKVTIPDRVYCDTDMKKVIDGSNMILHITPSKFVRTTIKQYKEYITNQPVIMCSKGFENQTLYTLSQVMEEEIPNVGYGIFSGPSHAEEVSLGIPTAIVIASKSEEIRSLVQNTFMNEKMRVYTSDDVKGVELGGALKNIIAFCAGIAAEIGLGDNSFAALATRGLVEISKLGTILGGKKETFYGLTGLGDLIVTCLSEHSRNRSAGKLIGRGLSVAEAQKEIGMTIESIDNIEVAYTLAKQNNIEMPIVETVYDVLYNHLDPKEAVKKLMLRDKKSE